MPNQNDYSNGLIEHYDNGYLITGGYNDFNGWLVKTDINGNVLWDIILVIDPDLVLIAKTIFDDQGNMYVFGTMKKENLDHEWPLVVKLNACGEKQWCRLLNFTGYEYGFFTDAILLDNGDLLGLASLPNEDQHDMIYLICLSPDGEYKWKQSYASCDNYPDFEAKLGSRIQKFGDKFFIRGYVYSPHPDYPGIVSIRPMFIGIDTLFNEQWVLEFGLVDNMKGKAQSSIQINDSLFMGVGRYRHWNVHDAWAMLYNKEGEQVGYKVFTPDLFGSEVNQASFYNVERINDSLFLATSGFFHGEDSANWGEIIFDTLGNVYSYQIRENVAGGSTNLIKTFDNKYTIATSYLYSNLTWDVLFLQNKRKVLINAINIAYKGELDFIYQHGN